jgi:trk system potassium uptake protein TrkA
MRVIICGAGQVGYNIASYLSREDNDVTVIDVNSRLISQINEDLDVNGIVGHASNPESLSAAGANEAELIVAVTYSDEVNMVACQVAHSLFNVPKKIARVREQSYLEPAWSNLFSRFHMPIDVIISL